ncbi:MAG: copper homeostasis protein CutC [Candidatus Cloacimonetes bacterium]|nr:copper homeostasis protein CutC [Candidatus Cloacimonadota bacterium]
MTEEPGIILEICADSPDAAFLAERNGADRIELCAALDVGGITPSEGMIRIVRQHLQIPLMVLIRPRMGDFCYSKDELAVMKADVKWAKDLGVDGVVFGILEPNGNLDLERVQELVQLAQPLSVTFHRAFDFCVNPLQALEGLISMGIDRILTSGQQQTAMQGASLIRELMDKAGERIIVMPGSGINSGNVIELLELTHAREIHLSASHMVAGRMRYHNQYLSLQGGIGEDTSVRTLNVAELQKIKELF